MYGAEENAAGHGGGEAPIYFTDADFSTANILIELPIRQHSTTVMRALLGSVGARRQLIFTGVDFSTAYILIEFPIRQHSTMMYAADENAAGLGGGKVRIINY